MYRGGSEELQKFGLGRLRVDMNGMRSVLRKIVGIGWVRCESDAQRIGWSDWGQQPKVR